MEHGHILCHSRSVEIKARFLKVNLRASALIHNIFWHVLEEIIWDRISLM